MDPESIDLPCIWWLVHGSACGGAKIGSTRGHGNDGNRERFFECNILWSRRWHREPLEFFFLSSLLSMAERLVEKADALEAKTFYAQKERVFLRSINGGEWIDVKKPLSYLLRYLVLKRVGYFSYCYPCIF